MSRSAARKRPPAKGRAETAPPRRVAAPPHRASGLAALILASACAAYRWGWGLFAGGADLDAARDAPWPETAATCVCLPACLLGAVTAFLMALHVLRRGQTAHRRIAIAALVVAAAALLPWFLMLRPT